MSSPEDARGVAGETRRVVTADDIDTLLFDVLGTVVDEAGAMRAELAAALDQAAAGRQTEVLATAWTRRLASGASDEGATHAVGGK